MIKNFIKHRKTERVTQLLNFDFKNKHYRIEFLNTGFDSFKGQDGKNSQHPLNHQHTHPVFHLLLFSEGSYHYLHNNKRISFTPGTFTVTSPDEPHKFGPFPCQHINSYYFLTFSLVEIKTGNHLSIDFKTFLGAITNESIGDIHFPVKLNKRQTAIFENLTCILTKQLNSKAYLSSFSIGMTMMDIINFILHECFRQNNNSDFKIHISPLEKAKQFIENNFVRHLTIQDIASMAALEPSYFIRKFKEIYHITPINYQMELKINAAKTLLQTTDYQINDIAERIGVNDIYYFSRIFKKATGTTPSLFRKNNLHLT